MELSNRTIAALLGALIVVTGAVTWKGAYAIAKWRGLRYDESFMTVNPSMSKQLELAGALSKDVGDIICMPMEKDGLLPKRIDCSIHFKNEDERFGYAIYGEEAEGVTQARAADLAFRASWSGDHPEVMLQVNPEKMTKTEASNFIARLVADAPVKYKKAKEADEADRLRAMPEAKRNLESWKK